jgi:hypothetical protein
MMVFFNSKKSKDLRQFSKCFSIIFQKVSVCNNSLDVMLGGAGDDVSSGETDSQSQREVAALIQKLLAKATHPSPAKVPCFTC